MPAFEDYKTVKILSPVPEGDGGQVLNDNFRSLADADESLAASVAQKADAASLTAHASNTNNPHATTAAQVGAVPTSRAITTTSPLSGGGSLGGDLTISVSLATTTSAGAMSSTDKINLTN